MVIWASDNLYTGISSGSARFRGIQGHLFMHHYRRKQPVNPLFARLCVLFRKPQLRPSSLSRCRETGEFITCIPCLVEERASRREKVILEKSTLFHRKEECYSNIGIKSPTGFSDLVFGSCAGGSRKEEKSNAIRCQSRA
jgi:hypothetical protein